MTDHHEHKFDEGKSKPGCLMAMLPAMAAAWPAFPNDDFPLLAKVVTVLADGTDSRHWAMVSRALSLESGPYESGSDEFFSMFSAVTGPATFGEAKYARDSWLTVPDALNRYCDAFFRHLMAQEENCSDSGLPHLHHAAWNALAVTQLLINAEKSHDKG